MNPTRKHIQQQILLMQNALHALADTPPKKPIIITTTGNPL